MLIIRNNPEKNYFLYSRLRDDDGAGRNVIKNLIPAYAGIKYFNNYNNSYLDRLYFNG